ncbi:enoyl-CoA hydratase [Rhizobium leguminosarum]|jgi:enoyl-CoA hydratase/carnithine racemase|uniref:Enoyl-CoA hydratase domain-containing protein 3, mitochondrial n=1 Tax=Rhizobium leguminosarum bv. viciae TaxID=387 RepID=A0A7G6RIU5_RHILV|nr:enoyl-CoA hydratase [Rhizobium leguminosarum]MBA8834737.1 enoyl-CoA hydratase/carnithine racemase [Rhizobium leguminosarum]MBY5900784.1 enoyl-CoA hydratase [Rhizobium leguminosarum]MBY5906986.1 enoyl-CoA hydratase [Rhizobium leguminosarum]MDH6272563.1 enoyl-CoA hydratase/carnithine racemase [Rhizobium leguminosarum]MVO95338.1 enoyl-CoA hydratase [Rhizobium leguminosarum bv. phaseoli]
MAEIVSFPDAARAEEGGLLIRSLRDGVLRLVLNNPPANVFSIALLEALMGELETAEAEPDVRVVVIASTGNVFSAGHDLKELTTHRADEDQGADFFEKTFRLAADLMLKIAHLPKPVIAEIDGLATAAGCQLVASCDLAICTDSSTFCTPGVNIGLFCSTPMVAVSRAAHRKQAMEMLLTGETIDASTAKDFGLVNRIVPKQYLAQVVSKYAAVIASKSPLTLKIGKEAFNRQLELPVEAAYDYTARVMVENMLTQDAQEGIGAFLGKRKPDWKGE